MIRSMLALTSYPFPAVKCSSKSGWSSCGQRMPPGVSASCTSKWAQETVGGAPEAGRCWRQRLLSSIPILQFVSFHFPDYSKRNNYVKIKCPQNHYCWILLVNVGYIWYPHYFKYMFDLLQFLMMKPLLLMVTVTLFWLVNPQFWWLNHCYSWNILTIYYLPIRFLHHFPGYTFCCLNPPVFECFWPFKPTIQAQTTPGLASLPRHRSPGRFRRLATPGTGALHGRSPKGGFTWRRGGGAVQLGSTARGETFSEWEIHYLD